MERSTQTYAKFQDCPKLLQGCRLGIQTDIQVTYQYPSLNAIQDASNDLKLEMDKEIDWNLNTEILEINLSYIQKVDTS